jgi:GNAT superfamily N-acetyltransferase
MINYRTFVPGGINPPEALEAAGALSGMLREESQRSYARMMLYRLAGKAAGECEDRYFIAVEDGQCVSRIWYGWGRHRDAVGNFGNFRTAEDHQRRGIGRSLLEMLIASVRNSADLPRCLFCTCSQPHLVRMYGALGFRPALEGTDRGLLYCPLGGSPDSFNGFIREYYRPARSLHFAPGTVGFRHEVDCLLAFSLHAAGETNSFGLKSFPTYEAAFLALAEDPAAGKLERVATEDDRTVGWAFTAAGGEREIQLYPAFRKMTIQENS